MSASVLALSLTAAGAAGAQEPAPGGRLPARVSLGLDLPAGLVLQSNVGYAHGTRGGAPFRRGLASLWLMRRIMPPFGVYVEVYGWSRTAPGRGPETSLHSGVTLRTSPGLHLDLHAGTDLTGGSDARWIGVGLRQRT